MTFLQSGQRSNHNEHKFASKTTIIKILRVTNEPNATPIKFIKMKNEFNSTTSPPRVA